MNTNLIEEKVLIPGKVTIGATVSYTNKSKTSPAIVLIMGTGKTDRDGNQKGFHTDFYKNLAALFTGYGFVCARYDKRGTYQTGGQFKTAGLRDLTDDSILVIKYVKNLSYVDESRVIVCGHSEGAMIASLLTQR
jgi:alpha/beta superfamily hydrolase